MGGMRERGNVDRIDSPKVWTNENLNVDQVAFSSRVEAIGSIDDGLGVLVDRVREQLTHGPGVALARGVTASGDKQAASGLLLRVGRLLGEPMRQDAGGTLAYEVSDYARDLAGLPRGHSRGANNNLGIGLHTENDGEPKPPDVVMFLCLQSARDGGETVLGSGYFAHNLLLEQSYDALSRLYEQIDFALRPEDYGDGLVSDAVFTARASGVRMRYSRYWIERAATIRGCPLDKCTISALDALD